MVSLIYFDNDQFVYKKECGGVSVITIIKHFKN